MDDKIIATFCRCDDLLKAIHHQEDCQCQMNDAEIMTTALVASLCFRGNQESARAMLKQHGYIPHMVSKSRLSRRLHRIKELFIVFFDLLSHPWKALNTDAVYSIDSLPIAVGDPIRIRRSKRYSQEDFRGYQASKKRYFYGLQIHLMVTQDGQPVACFLTPGSCGDVDALKYYASELPDGAIIDAEKAQNDYEIEDLLKEVDHIPLLPIRKKNSKRALSPSIAFVQSSHRQRVETAGSLIAQLLPKSIHAVTAQGFALKVALFVIASSLNCYLNLQEPCRQQLGLNKVGGGYRFFHPIFQEHLEWRALFDGQVLVEAVENSEGLPGLRAMFVVIASWERIWAVLLDYEHFPAIFTGIDKMKVLESDEHGATLEFWVDAVLKKYHYVLYRHYEKPGQRLTWKRLSGDLERIEGSWEIQTTPQAGVHLLVYDSYVRVGGVIPTALVRWGAMRKARDMGKRLRDWIERPSSEK